MKQRQYNTRAQFFLHTNSYQFIYKKLPSELNKIGAPTIERGGY